MVQRRQDISRGRPGLAALVTAYQHGGDDLLASIADWLGYEQREELKKLGKVSSQASGSVGGDIEIVEAEPSSPLPPSRSYLPWPFWRVTGRTDRSGQEHNPEKPEWLKPETPMPSSDPDAHTRTPLPEMLAPMKRLWPMLINDLSHTRNTTLPDIPKIVKRLSLGLPMPVKLSKQRTTWAETIHIIVDTADHLFPYRADVMRMVKKMRNRVGSRRLKILRFTSYPGGPWEGWYLDHSPGNDVYSAPHEHGRVCILGDLGVLKHDDQTGAGWEQFIEKLHRKNIPVFIFSPASVKKYSPKVRRMAKFQPWDARARFSRHIGAARREHLSRPQPAELKKLKILLSCTSLFTPGLLRRLRTRFLPQSPSALEGMIWKETETFTLSGSMGAWKQDGLETYREEFRKEKLPWKEEVVQVVTDYFQGFPTDFLAVQEIIAGALTNKPAYDAKQTLKALLSATWHGRSQHADLTQSFLRFFIDNQDTTDWQKDDDLLHTAFVVANREELDKGFPENLPKGCNPDKLRWVVAEPPRGKLVLRQANTSLLCNLQDSSQKFPHTISLPGQLYTTKGQPLWQDTAQVWRELKDGQEFTGSNSLRIHTGNELLEIEALAFADLAWASALARDKIGLYADLEIKGITQRFRWLEPGSFMMGSPKNEPERYNDETLHKVHLSKGFWMADTTVTQELWRVVMGDNPSDFKGEKRPVEMVSWKDAQKFIKKLNGLVPGLSVRLPTEAEWEYGCRAGTTTPFSFGENITPDQVNYDGNFPYNNGRKGKCRDETVEVKSLPCNNWGLYEMHGNVWEWCRDWYQKDLGRDEATDPQGPERGEDRVLRGGSWFDDGRGVRSALRSWSGPGDRIRGVGFRLARGH